MTFSGSDEATAMSISPIVETCRRKLPKALIFRQAGSPLSHLTISSAIEEA